MQDQETAVADQNTTDEFAITEALSVRESRLAVVLFELLKPQIEKLLDQKIAKTIQGIVDDEEFDISNHESAINDMIEDYVRYNITITSTID